jgi:REP element-mobilizing transposase RayT
MPVFNDLRAGRLVVQEMVRSARVGDTGTLAFVVMPDHLHWLFCLSGKKNLSSVIAGVKRSSSRQIHMQLDLHDSPVWQRGFHDHALRKEEDIKSVARYIVANPIRAGLVRRAGDYPLWDAVWL